MTEAAPTFRFLIGHPAHFIAMGFGVGMIPIIPGTFGTLLAIPIATGLWNYTTDLGYIAVTAAAFAIGVWASHVTGRDLGAADAHAIVWDEVVAFLLILYFVGAAWNRIAIAFVLFRIFDIVKPPPVRQVDAIKNGFGVMADDALAAGYTLIVVALWQRVFG